MSVRAIIMVYRLLPKGDQMKIGNVMKRDVPTVTEKATLGEVVRLMASSGTSGVPVVNSEGILVGIVTEHDVIKTVVPSYEFKPDESSKLDYDFLLHKRALQVRDNRVSMVMTQNVLALTEDDPVIKAMSTMLMKKIKILPVVDESGFYVGMVSRIDVAQAVLETEDLVTV
jgi:CBS domain-containing protein